MEARRCPCRQVMCGGLEQWECASELVHLGGTFPEKRLQPFCTVFDDMRTK